MRRTAISVTDAARNFADCVNRAHYQNVTFVLLKNGSPVARLIPDSERVCSGRDLAEIDYYVALGYWKIAVILEGVYVRYASGAYGTTDESWRSFESVVPKLAEAAAEAASRSGR